MEETVRSGDGRVGAQLAAAREERGLSLDEIAERTRIPMRSLELIEAGAKDGLPALTYSAGFVRSYAAALGLDGQAMAQQFRAEMGRPVRRDVPEPYAPADPARVPTRLLVIVALVLALLVAGGYAIWRGDALFGSGAEQREQLAAGTDPAVYPPPESGQPQAPLVQPGASPAGPVGGPVTVTAREEVWLRIAEREGKTLFLGTMTPGQSFTVPDDAIDPVLRTGRPQALDVKVGTAVMASLGPPDTLVREASLKRDALSQAAALPPPAAQPIAPLVPPSTRP
ncbi:helix-turn-helix domain-containing protein [Sphingomonas jatrophae]|uniref:HTH cro/C1-type domain-containing protein n=1 Tax=Sphingomonas jatrophae TaxID=1166337 RepID=A0A1I6L3A3_9SPHN|nr:helix-turn-helix domain-containing protein [Sphingomonas jatrophae]SFR97916.1 protein of unknown function [Sphingomonas jatrophae]